MSSLVACFVILTNLSGQTNAIDINKITAIEQNENNSIIYVDRSGTSLTTPNKLEKVLLKIKESKAACKLGE